MPETPKDKTHCDPVEPHETKDDDSWDADQKKHDYYYDDSHAYEKYDPDDEEDDE